MEKGFSPVGLRVLVVDDDPTWIKILEKMLKKCSYEVTTCGLAREALRLLRERKDGFDIVISDVNMPDMDGFKLLEHVGLELDLPVIMMSVDGETSRVMKGVQHGACDYLLKPIRMKELKIIWQHVLRKKLQEVRDIEGCCYDVGGAEWFTQSQFLGGGGEEVSFGKKRKDFDFEKKLLQDESDPSSSSSKKARVVWSYELHQKFVNAVNQIGCDHKAGPKKILDLMNIPWLTRENVASHLQKYRLYLSRLEKGKEIKCYSGGVKNMDSPPKDAEINSGSPGKTSYAFVKATETEPKQQLASASSGSDPTSDVHMPPKAKKTRIGFDPPISSGVFDSLLPWNDVPDPLESKPPILYESSFLQQQQPLASQSSYVANSAPSLMQEEMKPSYENTAGGTCVNADEFLMPQDLDLSAPSAVPCVKLQEFSSNATSTTELNLELPEAHLSGSDLDFGWLQGEHFFANTGLQNFQFQDYSYNPSLLSELPPHLWFGNERLSDPDEYTLMVDQGTFHDRMHVQ